MLQTTGAMIATIDDEIDKFILSGYKRLFDPGKVIKKEQISSRTAIELHRHYSPLKEELSNIGEDPQLTEAYAFLKGSQKTSYLKQIDGILAIFDTIRGEAKTKRKPRRKKVRSPEELTKDITLHGGKLNFGDGDIVTKPASSIIRAKTVYLFNVKYNLFTMLVASSNDGLTVKGQTILGWDETKSLSRRIKPHKFLRYAMTQGALDLILNKGTKAGAFVKVTGRIGDNTIIIRTYQ